MRTLLDLFDSRPEAAAIAGVTPEHLASYISGKAKPPFELVSRLAAAKGVSLQWMASGEGKLDLSGEEDGFVHIPVSRIDASSGTGKYPMADDVREHIAFARNWLRAVIREPEDKLLVVFNRGEDNEPDIKDGDALLVVTGLTRVAHDGYHVFKTDSERMITRKAKIYVDGRVGLSTCKSEDKPEMSSAEDANRWVFGRVCWRGGIL
ncbi:MAG: LexA family transcriptional regulator [Rhizomicrobium sp.]